MKYVEINVFNKEQLDRIKVDDVFIYNGQNKYPMTVMAVTKDFIVGIKVKGDDYEYSLITKPIDGWARNEASPEYPHIGPDSYYCLGYKTKEEAQKNLNKIQAWYDASLHGMSSEEYKNYQSSELKKYYETEDDQTPGKLFNDVIKHYRMITQDPRSRQTINLRTLKVRFKEAGTDNAS